MMQHRSAIRAHPLQDLKILVTRPRSQAAEMSGLIRSLGAEPVELPALEIDEDPYPERSRQAIDNLSGYDWIVFTSTNGVEVFLRLLRESTGSVARLNDARVAAVGDSTAECLRDRGVDPDLVPESFHGDALLEAMRRSGVDGARILMPRAEVARETLPNGLRESGATVDIVPVYRTVPARPDSDVLSRLTAGEIDIVTFTSSSAVNNLVAMLDGRAEHLASTRIACIGPVTARTVREHRLEPWVVATEHSVPGLVNAIRTALEETA